jgi:hypothetical protein
MSRLQRALGLVKVPLRAYNELAQKHPFETGIGTTVIKTSLADLFAQKVRQRVAPLTAATRCSSPASR